MVISENDTVNLAIRNPEDGKLEVVAVSRYHAEMIRLLRELSMRLNAGVR